MRVVPTRRSLIGNGAGVAALIICPSLASTQSVWPTKPVTIVVSVPPGGAGDTIARAFAQHVSQTIGQQLIVDNRPGASGNIAAAQVARAPADGHTFLFAPSSTFVQNRVLFKTLGFDADKDFTLVAGIVPGPLPIAVHKSVPATNLKEFIAYAKTNTVNFGSFALGSTPHVIVHSLNSQFGLSIEIVTYKGEAPMWQDMGAGLLQAAMGSPQAMNALLMKGDVRGIVVPGRARAKQLPNVSTASEQGFYDDYFATSGWLGLAAPAATPIDIVKRMSAVWVSAADSEPGRKVADTFGLVEKPMTFDVVSADYEALKRTLIPRVTALGITLE